MPALIVTLGPDEGRTFRLKEQRISVGRHTENTIQLTDKRVSRRHLELRLHNSGDYQLFDLQSGNGTKVNGRVIQVIDLRDNDQISLGGTTLRYRAKGKEPAGLGVNEGTSGRLILEPSVEFPSAILKTVRADLGSQILSNPTQAANEWLRVRLANLSVMYEASSAASQILDVDELLERIIDLIVRTTDADHGCAMLRDPETGELVPKAIRSQSAQPSPDDFVVSRTVVDHVLREKQGVLLGDASVDERFEKGESIAKHKIREVICVPMKGRHETVGVLFLDTYSRQSQDGEEQPMKFSDDHLTLAIAVAHQAALAIEETQHYQAMLQSERLAAVGQTIAALSHHIKNIMQGVRFGSDMIRIGLKETDLELLGKGWRLVEKNQARIDHLILDMLSYSKDREPAFEAVELHPLIREVLEIVQGRANDAEVRFRLMLDDTVPTIQCDTDGIHRALLNLVSNAIDALNDFDTEKQRIIEVATQWIEGEKVVEIVVHDNGPGIPPEVQADIFKPFVSTKGSRGTGLGLPVSRKIIQEHGGDVILESEPGEGTTFRVRLPSSDNSSGERGTSVP